MTTWRKSIPSLVLWVVWLATRTALYLPATAPSRIGDVSIYQKWYTCCFSHGTFPVADPMWQYRPAQPGPWPPGRLPGSYVGHFMFLAIGCDLAITVMLCSSARRGGSLAGAWYWVCGVPLLVRPPSAVRCGPVALAVAALRANGPGGVRGALIGAGVGSRYGRQCCWPGWLRPVAPRCAGSGSACRGLRRLHRRNGELPSAPERPRRRDRSGRSDAVHDLAASWLAWDGGVPVRRVAASGGTSRSPGTCPAWAASSQRLR